VSDPSVPPARSCSSDSGSCTSRLELLFGSWKASAGSSCWELRKHRLGATLGDPGDSAEREHLLGAPTRSLRLEVSRARKAPATRSRSELRELMLGAPARVSRMSSESSRSCLQLVTAVSLITSIKYFCDFVIKIQLQNSANT